MKRLIQTSFIALVSCAIASTAQAQIVVLGNGAAHDCYISTKSGNSGTADAIKLCSDALGDALSKKDRAATHVNRGVLQMRKGEYAAAKADYEIALKMKPELTEAYINYGATLLYLNETDAALTALNTAIDDLGADQIPEALYNRALVHDRQENFKAAYYDLKRALELRPDWTPAQTAIGRYSVTSRKSGS
ncbi:tetratricopeptide repeat protein [Litorimonas sp. RW-G-Af-16]|uniref:tetratricopeptide repeat protein n=1 Tax=Litorimonas sp. RW-G-Af-16 TaxID=3241168 RepID=UPI00390C57DD